MKLSAIILRTLLGAVFATGGYLLTNNLFPECSLLGIAQLLPTLVAFVLGAFSILILPVLGLQISSWFHDLIGSIMMENLSKFWEGQMDRFRDRSPFSQSPAVEQEKNVDGGEVEGGVVLDTSVIIDGRILDIVKAGFLSQDFVVPRFVIEELQDVADSEDDIRRRKGRRGLETLEQLRELKSSRFTVFDKDVRGKDIDRKLITLAKKREAKLLTVDFNLNKAARVSGVKVLNINELANALRMDFVPGENLSIELIQKGKEDGQGVGYLEDGTMVVVEDAEKRIGEEVKVEVTRSLQTEAGRMIFARSA